MNKKTLFLATLSLSQLSASEWLSIKPKHVVFAGATIALAATTGPTLVKFGYKGVSDLSFQIKEGAKHLLNVLEERLTRSSIFMSEKFEKSLEFVQENRFGLLLAFDAVVALGVHEAYLFNRINELKEKNETLQKDLDEKFPNLTKALESQNEKMAGLTQEKQTILEEKFLWDLKERILNSEIEQLKVELEAFRKKMQEIYVERADFSAEFEKNKRIADQSTDLHRKNLELEGELAKAKAILSHFITESEKTRTWANTLLTTTADVSVRAATTLPES
jgi:hypothetical protein